MSSWSNNYYTIKILNENDKLSYEKVKKLLECITDDTFSEDYDDDMDYDIYESQSDFVVDVDNLNYIVSANDLYAMVNALTNNAEICETCDEGSSVSDSTSFAQTIFNTKTHLKKSTYIEYCYGDESVGGIYFDAIDAYENYIERKALEKGIKPDWDFSDEEEFDEEDVDDEYESCYDVIARKFKIKPNSNNKEFSKFFDEITKTMPSLEELGRVELQETKISDYFNEETVKKVCNIANALGYSDIESALLELLSKKQQNCSKRRKQLG